MDARDEEFRKQAANQPLTAEERARWPCATDAAAQSARREALENAFRNADEKDWDHLYRFIPYSGHGQFWLAVFDEVRKALAASIEPQVSVAHANEPSGPEAVKPTPSNDGVTELPSEEWQDIETAPRDGTSIIVGCPRGSGFVPVVGEAYYLSDEGEDGAWWWANTSPGDYAVGSLESRGDHPTLWQPLPATPSFK